jgi:aspartyl-tRNA(Asn)/glutamyl-tRNA(Gln) amidotransferase subunit C
MAVNLSRDDVVKLARLARLSLSDDEVSHFQSELGAILGYVEKLADADTTGLEPTSQVTGLMNVTRADEIQDYGYDTASLLALAPAQQDGHIKVKRMIG